MRLSNTNGHALPCLHVVPRLRRTVDTVVTSPPYNVRLSSMSGHNGRHWAAKARNIGYTDHLPEPVYQAWLDHVVSVCSAACRGLVWLNHKTRYRDGQAINALQFIRQPLYCEVVWDRKRSFNFNVKRFASSHESLFAFGSPHFWDASLDTLKTVWQIDPVYRRTDHPCPFPLELAARPIRASCPVGGVVLDPFAGSCTVGVAALAHGRKFIGIEKNPAYVDDAIERLKGWRTETAKAA